MHRMITAENFLFSCVVFAEMVPVKSVWHVTTLLLQPHTELKLSPWVELMIDPGWCWRTFYSEGHIECFWYSVPPLVKGQIMDWFCEEESKHLRLLQEAANRGLIEQFFRWSGMNNYHLWMEETGKQFPPVYYFQLICIQFSSLILDLLPVA